MIDLRDVVISGATRLLGLIADPVAQARSPVAANEWLAQHGRLGRFVLVPLHVCAAHLAGCVSALRGVDNFLGAIVSMPHKIPIVDLLDALTPEAERVGAVNVIRRDPDGRLTGTLLDGEGFVAGLAAAGHSVAGKKCVLAGAGGAAAAVAFALAQHGCQSLWLLNRTAAKAAALAVRIRRHYPALPIGVGIASEAQFDIAINGTSLGMNSDDVLPFAAALIERTALVAECVLAPEMTQLLSVAKRYGCAIHTGVPMLSAQLPMMLDFMGVNE